MNNSIKFNNITFNGNNPAITSATQPVKAYGPYNLKDCSLQDFISEAHKMFRYTKPVMTLTGYMSQPTEHVSLIENIFASIRDNLGIKDSGIVISPTPDSGCVDIIATAEGFRNTEGTHGLLHITPREYAQYISDTNLPHNMSRVDYNATTKYVVPSIEDYAQAIAKTTNVAITTGGRNDSVREFVNAIKEGNLCVIINNTQLNNPAWDSTKKRVENASKYLSEQLSAFFEGKSLPYNELETQGFTKTFLSKYKRRLESVVKIIDVSSYDKAQYKQIGKKIAVFIKDNLLKTNKFL